MNIHSKSITLQAIALVTALAASQGADAGMVVAASSAANGYTVTVQGSPQQPTAVNGISSVNPAIGVTTYNAGSNQAAVTFANGAAIETTPNTSNYAAPVINSSGAVVSPFFSTNSNVPNPSGSYTLTFSTAQLYLGLLWGSIGTGDLLTFYNGSTQVATVTGTTAIAAATNYNPTNGAQNFGGSQYELINFLNGSFTSVVFSQTQQASFESANIEYAQRNVAAVPEPASVLLLGIGFAGIVASRRRKAVPA